MLGILNVKVIQGQVGKINFLPIELVVVMCSLRLKGSLVSSINLYFDVTTRVQPQTFGGQHFLVIDPLFAVAYIFIIFLNYLLARGSSLAITIYFVKVSHIPVKPVCTTI